MTDRILALIDRALVSEDEAWVRAEQAVLDAIASSESVESGRAHADPLGRLLVADARDRIAAGEDPMRKAASYLDAVEARFSNTAALVPPVSGVVEMLTRMFGPHLTKSLALRLSQQPNTAHWRVMTAMGYLDQHKDPAVTEALIRFAARTSVPLQERAAVHVLRNLGDPALAPKIEAERRQLLAAGKPLPPALADLAAST